MADNINANFLTQPGPVSMMMNFPYPPPMCTNDHTNCTHGQLVLGTWTELILLLEYEATYQTDHPLLVPITITFYLL